MFCLKQQLKTICIGLLLAVFLEPGSFAAIYMAEVTKGVFDIRFSIYVTGALELSILDHDHLL